MSLLLKKLLGEVPMVYSKGGGKGAAAPAPQPLVAPAPPVQEASVEIDEDTQKKKMKTSKESLKIPLADTSNVGLKV